MIWRPGFWLCLLMAALAAAPARAQGGSAAPGGTGASGPVGGILAASSDRYELLLKFEALSPNKITTLDLYLSDFATNAPIAGARIGLSLRAGGRELWSGNAAATTRPGVYEAPFTAPPDTGSYVLLVSVQAGGAEDRFALPGVAVTTAARSSPAGEKARPMWFWFLAAAAATLIALVAWHAGRRSAATRASAGLALLVGLVAGAPALHAHAGHDDAPAASGIPVGPGAQVYMAKGSQFLLGVRTEPLRRSLVQKRLSFLGRVAPRGGGEVDIIAPQSGRVYFPGNRVPVMGERILKGATVARLVVVDELRIGSPLAGQVTGVYAVNGQLVEAGQKILSVLDPTVVWVHADVYESDLESVQRSTRALITSQTMPDLSLAGRRVALSAGQGEVPGAVEAWFEVPNPRQQLRVGALVEVGIEQGTADSALVVARSAIFERDGRSLLFVHTAPERFTAREVHVTANLGGRLVITGDLKPGERVVVAGGYSLLSSPVVSVSP